MGKFARLTSPSKIYYTLTYFLLRRYFFPNFQRNSGHLNKKIRGDISAISQKNRRGLGISAKISGRGKGHIRNLSMKYVGNLKVWKGDEAENPQKVTKKSWASQEKKQGISVISHQKWEELKYLRRVRHLRKKNKWDHLRNNIATKWGELGISAKKSVEGRGDILAIFKLWASLQNK